jgi:hypothetical protein
VEDHAAAVDIEYLRHRSGAGVLLTRTIHETTD